ncbi:MAG TPA: UvrD-helicase domain-containing protein, partial [Acidimicrobiales bacterium]|nr:UvrD-helicase domain-containing protein [Acidimicrobiales bacterium]
MTTEPVAEPATEAPVETSTAGQTEPFDLCGALPVGTTVLEASAGTGKTFAIAALAARYVAEGVPLERMLLVTFTRMATGELRERVRERLLSVLKGLDLHLAGRPVDPTDAVLNLLATGPPAAVAVRRARLATAVAGFDAATITTTHGFCQQMLASLGLAGNAESDLTIVEDIEDLLAETVDDLVLARVRRGQAYQLRRRQALATARAALEQPGTPLADVPAEPGSAERQRYNLARTVRTRMEERKRRARVITYDDLLTRLAAAIAHPVGGPSAVRRLRRRFDVVLVDEFQDTDRLQWLILARAFKPEVSPIPQASEEPEPGAAPRALVLIGDPKQAIYAFRGADVHAYLDATRHAVVRTLDVNWRTDQALVDAANALFHPSRLGHPDIVYRPVRAAPCHQEPGLVGAPETAALRFRVLHRDDGLVRRTSTGWAQVAPSRAVIAKDLAADVVRLLSSGAETLERDDAGVVVARRRIRPGDIAVL